MARSAELCATHVGAATDIAGDLVDPRARLGSPPQRTRAAGAATRLKAWQSATGCGPSALAPRSHPRPCATLRPEPLGPRGRAGRVDPDTLQAFVAADGPGSSLGRAAPPRRVPDLRNAAEFR